MTKAEASARINKLRDQINDYRYHYHVLDESILSEPAADSLKHELAQLEAEYPDLVTPDSPSQRVAGAILDGFKSVPHSSPMISLVDVFSREEMSAWIDRTEKLLGHPVTEYFAEIKKDGLACALTYSDGVLSRGLTRGDGLSGEDVTANVRTIESVPLKLRQSADVPAAIYRGTFEIRGEVLLYKKDLERLNARQAAAGKPLYANPRNTAAGTLRQLDPQLVSARGLRFLAYLVQTPIAELPTLDREQAAARAIGLPVEKHGAVVSGLEGIMDFVEYWSERRRDLPFNTDGIVITVNANKDYDALGVVGKAPRGAVAFKYPAEEATTVVKDIVISIGRTGAATPIATFEPVVVAGTTVTHASLHNQDEISRLDVRVDDTVVIYKAGDIIPKVLQVLPKLRPKNSHPFDMARELSRQYPELEFIRPDGEVVFRVKGATGPILTKKAIEHFASKPALDIDTLGEKNVVALVDAGLVEDPADLYRLIESDLLALDRFAEVSARNLIAGIAATRHPALPRFIFALGIRHVGNQTAVDLAESFGSLGTLSTASLDQLQAVEGVGMVVAESILAWFAEDDNQELLNKFERLGVHPVPYKKIGGPLVGVKFVITGTLELGSRDEVASRLVALGAKEQSSVGRDTSYLIVGSDPGESKRARAAKLSIPQLDEVALGKLLSP